MNEEQKNNQAEEEVKSEEQPAAETPKETKSEKKKSEKLEEKIKKLEEESGKKDEKYMRVLAEYDNFRKRSQKEKEATYSDAQLATIGAFLPVLDNLERGAAAEDASEGVKLICKQMQEILKKMNVEECGKEGDAFDPNFHNAVMHAEGEGSGETVIQMVLQKGYTMNGKLIRAAMVKTTD